METVDNGSLWLRQSLSIGTETSTKVKIGVLDNDQIFNANDNFIVNKDGTAKMTGNLRIKGTYADLLVAATTQINSDTQDTEDLMGLFLCKKDGTINNIYATIGCYQDSNNTRGVQIYSTGNMAIGTDTSSGHKMALSSNVITCSALGGLGLYTGSNVMENMLTPPSDGNIILSAQGNISLNGETVISKNLTVSNSNNDFGMIFNRNSQQVKLGIGNAIQSNRIGGVLEYWAIPEQNWDSRFEWGSSYKSGGTPNPAIRIRYQKPIYDGLTITGYTITSLMIAAYLDSNSNLKLALTYTTDGKDYTRTI